MGRDVGDRAICVYLQFCETYPECDYLSGSVTLAPGMLQIGLLNCYYNRFCVVRQSEEDNQFLAKIGKNLTKRVITSVVCDIPMQSLVLR